MSDLCRVCGERPTTGTMRWGLDGFKIAVCDLCKAILERKNHYMPCVIGERLDSMSPDDQARVYRETYWADNITNAEWPVVLRHDGVKAYVRSRLKKKAVGWLVALSRIVRLNPKFGAQVLREADALYRKQVQEEPPIPWARLADLIEMGWSQDGLEGWLQPLGNLRGYVPAQLEELTEMLVTHAEGWELRTAGNGDGEEAEQ